MNTIYSSNLAAEAPAYAQLQRQMHDALLAQHPDWILPNGDCPTCDAYDARFAELLIQTLPTRRRGLDDPGNFSMPTGYAEPRNIVISKVASVVR